MEKAEIYEMMRNHPVLHLATSENGEARVRAVLLYSADDDGIVFHTGAMKDLYQQITVNPIVEMCFNDLKTGLQARVRGTLTEITDTGIKDTIAASPGREFLRPWRENGALSDFYSSFRVFSLKKGVAQVWTMETNFAPKDYIQL